MSSEGISMRHIPVMLEETLKYLVPPRPDCLMIDATLGMAGHSAAFLSRYPSLRLIGVDADKELQSIAKARLEPYAARTNFYNTYFDVFFNSYLEEIEQGKAERPGLILFDFGVSMYHFTDSKRGFSLKKDEYLDMRLSEKAEKSAADLVNGLSEQQLYKIISDYGEEPFAHKITLAITRERRLARIENSARLAEIIKSAVPPKARYGKIHPATRTFQAIRIAVNDELGRIERALTAALAAIESNGIIGCISFHSLEDRIVKQLFKAKACSQEKARYTNRDDTPIVEKEAERCLVVLTKKPVEPTVDEVSKNPAARSAKFRAAKGGGGQK